MKITFLGHASFLIEIKDKTLVVDPFISGNPLASDIDINDIKVDYILVTHGHQDHVLDVEAIAKNNPDATIVCNYEIYLWYEAKGFKAQPINHGGKIKFDFGTVKMVNAIHTSMLPDGSYGGNPGGFVVYNDEASFYIAGDTALTRDMELIPMTCPQLDIAIFPIGDCFTMGYEDAVIACDFIKCNKIIGCHYDTFPPIQLDQAKALAYFEKHGKELLLPKIGESVDV